MATFISGQLTTTATTAEQSVCSATPSGSTSFKSGAIAGYLTTYSATESNMGVVFWDVGGTNRWEARVQNTDLASLAGVIVLPFGDGITFSGAETCAWQVTPAAATSMRWAGIFIGQG